MGFWHWLKVADSWPLAGRSDDDFVDVAFGVERVTDASGYLGSGEGIGSVVLHGFMSVGIGNGVREF